ncbi:MAG: GNAT family N-acetyltransferase [Oscillospiraceae bacterium]|nr:GNAT family N-acetyltransferase [Oscillospiraceae bacterium]
MIFTENLVIREFVFSDSSQYYKNNLDGQIKKFMPNHYHETENEAIEEIKSGIENYEGFKDPCHWAIVKADTNELIGHIGIGKCEKAGIENEYEICCAINKDNRGNNYAAEAVRAFVPWCKNNLNTDRIYASTEKQNTASNKALLNAGFVLCGKEFENEKPNLNVYVFN